MPLYAYRCNNPACRHLHDSTFRGDQHPEPCPECHVGTLKRKFSVAVHRPMHEHFNATVNKPISDMGQFKRELRRAGDEYSERTGIAVDYQPKEWGELGATNEHLDQVNRERVTQGQKPLIVPE